MQVTALRYLRAFLPQLTPFSLWTIGIVAQNPCVFIHGLIIFYFLCFRQFIRCWWHSTEGGGSGPCSQCGVKVGQM